MTKRPSAPVSRRKRRDLRHRVRRVEAGVEVAAAGRRPRGRCARSRGALLDGDLSHADRDDRVGNRLASGAINDLAEDRRRGVLRGGLRRRTRRAGRATAGS